MNINSTISGTSYIRSQQFRYQKTSENKTIQKEQDQELVSKSVEITATIYSVEKTEKYDLENITPKETYALGRKLYEEDVIELKDFAILLARGRRHEYPPNKAGIYLTPNEAPFNLLEELGDVASGKDKKTKPTPAYTRNDYKNLLELLSSLQSTLEKSIDIAV